jgi:trans-aconitate 2-methyltransferase
MRAAKQNWNAQDYARNSTAQQEWARELIAKLSLHGHESILDIGCGDGKITAELSKLVGGNVVGIDSSADMIRTASAEFPTATYPNLSFVQMDAGDIRFNTMFDIAFSNAVLHWVEDQCTVLRGVHGCLKAGGKILFQMGGRGNAAEVLSVMQQVLQRSHWRRYYESFVSPYHFYGPAEYTVWLAQYGFQIARIELIPKIMQHTREGFMGWLRTTWFPYTDRLPVDLRELLLTEVVETYLQSHPIDAQGYTYINMVRLEIEATSC